METPNQHGLEGDGVLALASESGEFPDENDSDAIDEALHRGDTVYVHCLGGVDRACTATGCWLVRHGLTRDEPLVQVAERWKDMEKAWRVPCSPKTPEQREYVRWWEESSHEGRR